MVWASPQATLCSLGQDAALFGLAVYVEADGWSVATGSIHMKIYLYSNPNLYVHALPKSTERATQ